MSRVGSNGGSSVPLTVSSHQRSALSRGIDLFRRHRMSRPRMLLGGAVLVLLLGGIGVFQGCRNAAPPAAVVVTRFPAPESRSALAVRPGRSAQPAPATRPAGSTVGVAPSAAAVPHAPSELA